MMKQVLSFIFGVVLVGNFAYAKDGYLMITIGKNSYVSAGDPKNSTDIYEEQHYKILLNKEFFTAFKTAPGEKHRPKFYCGITDGSGSNRGFHWLQWFSPLDNGKIGTWYFGRGDEEINGERIYAETGHSGANFSNWKAIDVNARKSFVRYIGEGGEEKEAVHGVNVGFHTRYVDANEPLLAKALFAKVSRHGAPDFVPGDQTNGLELVVSCGFQ